MQGETKGKIYVLKEVFKLPMDKETNTVRKEDLFELIETVAGTIPKEDAKEFMDSVK